MFLLMKRWEQALTQQWQNKVFQKETPQATAEANAAALAQIEVIDKFLKLTHQELVEALTDDDA